MKKEAEPIPQLEGYEPVPRTISIRFPNSFMRKGCVWLVVIQLAKYTFDL